MKNLVLSVYALCLFSMSVDIQAQESKYQRPPQVLEEVALVKLSPAAVISEDNNWILQLERSPYRSIARLAQPELKLAGTRINPENFSQSRIPEFTGASLLNVKTQEEVELTGLPANAVILKGVFTPKSPEVLLFVEEPAGVYLYLADPVNKQLRKIDNLALNTTTGTDIHWINDQEFLTLAVPAGTGKAPEKTAVPNGPVIQESIGKVMPARTYQDLLKNKYDEQLFDYYFTSQLVKVTGGRVTPVGKPAVYNSHAIALSPDKSLLLVATIHTPYSYQVPLYYFPHTYTIADLDGNVVRTLAENPVINLPMGYDVTSAYPRNFAWRPDKPATIYWVEAQDGGNPRENKVEYKDVVYQLAAPFDQEPEEVVRTKERFRDILWHNDVFALVQETSRATRRVKTWQFKPATTSQPTLLFDVSTDDNYNNPGTPVMVKNEFKKDIVYTNKNYTDILLTAPGASPEGDMPYLSRFNLKDKKTTILWRSEAPYYERILKVADPAKQQLFTSRESVEEPANLFVREVPKKRLTQLTHFANPYLAMAGVTKEKIQYKRADGLDLTATVYLPAGYDKEKDGRLPVLMWAYPREYRSKADAAQVRGSKYAFTNINYGSPVYWVLRGFCVMENVEMPIVSTTEDAEPNDNFREQLVMNAEAAIKVIDEMGVGDTSRVAVGGHSYGAFMTANLLTQTKLFKAGIARSGAYNRTLTPFGFQTEIRTYWEIPEVYNSMSPFMYANQLHGALLLVHGEMDNNTGTFPIQSERFYNALKGHGATTRYVVLPYESHGYAARENILHLLYECDQWLEKYVKN
ncbi:MAG: prolyl oligopeptidase family serine peptidase [Tannerellaceae bacterium]|nr:prolyl oligopeptidase family serine peptidase [Tannerellaceae bacterium]MCD8263723.1 prolyl oligopeptidase family serine peptidase [Tannerellaceae bacterium]